MRCAANVVPENLGQAVVGWIDSSMLDSFKQPEFVWQSLQATVSVRMY